MTWLTLAKAAGYPLYLPLIWYAGNQFCRLVFVVATVRVEAGDGTPAAREAQTLKAGRYIGLFERLLIGIGIVVRHWEMIVAVIALKTVARYPELDKSITAEYFLVGSLASLLWALIATAALLAYDAFLGFDVLRLAH